MHTSFLRESRSDWVLLKPITSAPDLARAMQVARPIPLNRDVKISKTVQLFTLSRSSHKHSLPRKVIGHCFCRHDLLASYPKYQWSSQLKTLISIFKLNARALKILSSIDDHYQVSLFFSGNVHWRLETQQSKIPASWWGWGWPECTSAQEKEDDPETGSCRCVWNGLREASG